MTDQAASLPRQRTDDERRSYVDGFEAGAKFMQERLERNISGERAAIRASRVEVDSVVALMRSGP